MAVESTPPLQNPLERIGHTVREIPVWMGRHWKSVLLITAAGGAAISLNFLHDRGSQNPAVTVNNPISDTIKTADPGSASEVVVPAVPTEAPTATASPTPEPPPTQGPIKVPPTLTAEPTKAPIVEAEKDKPCTIVPEKYCSQAKLVERQTALGTTTRMIGIRIPADEPLSPPIDGQVAKTKLNDDVIFYKGYRAVIFDPSNPKRRYILTGDFQFDDMLSRNMKKGQVFGHTNNTGVEMLGYNFTFYVADIGPDNKEIVNEKEMQRLFPRAYDNPIERATTTPEGSTKAGGTININTFYSTSPK